MFIILLEALQIEVASITYEIDVKQQLVNELESQQRRISSMQRHYEDKLKMMAQTIRATELERDKVLKNLGKFVCVNNIKKLSFHQLWKKNLNNICYYFLVFYFSDFITIRLVIELIFVQRSKIWWQH